MRAFSFCLILPFLSLFSALPALAQDVSIHPNGSSPPFATKGTDLGLKPRPPSAQVQPAQNNPKKTDSNALATQTEKPPEASAEHPPYNSLNTGQENVLAPSSDSSNYRSEKLDNGAEIYKIDAVKQALPQGKGPYSLSVAIQPGAVGEEDKKNVSKILGLTEQEIISNCYFENEVMVALDGNQGEYLPLGTTQKAQVRFGRPLQSVSIYPTIACRKLRKPVSGIVIEQGGFYKMGTNIVVCNAPPDKSTGSVNFTFRYIGNNKGQCTF